MTEQYLLLKWGTLKGWNVKDNAKAMEALERYHADPTSMSAAMQHDTDAQRQALFDLIDAMPDDAPIQSDWSGETFTRETAKQYIADYGKPKAVSA
jgi:hypothetical protein